MWTWEDWEVNVSRVHYVKFSNSQLKCYVGKKNRIKNIMLHSTKDKYIPSYFLPRSSEFCPENLSEATFQSNGLSYRYVNTGYSMVTVYDW